MDKNNIDVIEDAVAKSIICGNHNFSAEMNLFIRDNNVKIDKNRTLDRMYEMYDLQCQMEEARLLMPYGCRQIDIIVPKMSKDDFYWIYGKVLK